MAASELTVHTIDRTSGTNLTDHDEAANVDGNYFTNTGEEFLYVNNGTATACVVTEVLGVGGKADGLTPTARTISVPGNKAMLIGPFPKATYNDASNRMNFTYDQVSSVTVLALKPGT